MASASSKIEMLKQKNRAAVAGVRRRLESKEMQKTLIRKGAIIATAGTYGTMNRFDVPVEVGGFPWKLAVMGLSFIGEATTQGPAQAAFSGVGDATMAIYLERSISTNTLVAGDGYDDYEDEDAEEEIIEATADSAEL